MLYISLVIYNFIKNISQIKNILIIDFLNRLNILTFISKINILVSIIIIPC